MTTEDGTKRARPVRERSSIAAPAMSAMSAARPAPSGTAAVPRVATSAMLFQTIANGAGSAALPSP